MYKIIGSYFERKRYNKIELNIKDVIAYEKGDTLYSIYNVQEETLTAAQIINIQKQLYAGLENSGVNTNNSIMFLCGFDGSYLEKCASDIKSEAKNNKNVNQIVGMVDVSRAMIMLEEKADEYWRELCMDIFNYINDLAEEVSEYSNGIEEKKQGTSLKEEIRNSLKHSVVWLTIINVIIFFSMNIVGYKKTGIIIEDYANNWIEIVKNLEWYRLITSMFLHSDIDHILGNMLSLCAMGIYLEKIIGRKKTLFTYFTSGIIAGLASLGYNMYLNEDINSIGASGAIYGLCGMFIIVLITFKNVFGKGSAVRLIIYLVLVGYTSMSTTNIDHMAHIGGLLAGMILGILIVLIPEKINRNKQVNRYED